MDRLRSIRRRPLQKGDTELTGLALGALIGAGVGGPEGAVIGGVIGFLLGAGSKKI